MHLDLRHEVLKNPWFRVGLGCAAFLCLAALVGPLLTPYDAHDMAFTPLAPPSGKHPLGVNDGGMDILTELLYSLRNTASFGILTALAALLLGGVIGMVSAWFGGWVDHVLMRVADILLAIPSIMILILTAALFRPTLGVLVLILATMSWPTTDKAFRAQTFVLKKKPLCPGGQTDGCYEPLYFDAPFHPRVLPSLLDRVCRQGAHGHVDGGLAGLSGPLRSGSKISRGHDQLCPEILLPRSVVELACATHRLPFSLDDERHFSRGEP